jgi:hypothetical protein
MGALDNALLLLDDERIIYESLPPSLRRLVNQAVFVALIVRDPETIQAERAPLYEALASLNRTLQQAPQTATSRPRTPQNKAVRSQKEPDPFSGGQGSYIEQMAEREGFEPSNEVNPRYAISSRAHSTALAPLHGSRCAAVPQGYDTPGSRVAWAHAQERSRVLHARERRRRA